MSANKWRKHPKKWVNGSIDSLGAIHAKATAEIEQHEGAIMNGKRWRWDVVGQEFFPLAPRTVIEANNIAELLHLTNEEHFTVCDWLIRHGFADESILPLSHDYEP